MSVKVWDKVTGKRGAAQSWLSVFLCLSPSLSLGGTWKSYCLHSLSLTWWSIVSLSPSGQNESGIAVHNDRIYVVGGYSIWTNEPLACIQVRDFRFTLPAVVILHTYQIECDVNNVSMNLLVMLLVCCSCSEAKRRDIRCIKLLHTSRVLKQRDLRARQSQSDSTLTLPTLHSLCNVDENIYIFKKSGFPYHVLNILYHISSWLSLTVWSNMFLATFLQFF